MALQTANMGGMITAFSPAQFVSNALYNSTPGSVTTEKNGVVGSTYRGLGAEWFNAENIAREDFLRNEQAAANQLQRDLYLFEKEKSFAREQMAWEKEMSDTSYTRAVEDLKRAGINPVMAISQGGASSPSAPSASHGSSRGGYGAAGASNSSQLLGSILSLVGGIYGAGAQAAVSLLNSSTAAKSRTDSAQIYANSRIKTASIYSKKNNKK